MNDSPNMIRQALSKVGGLLSGPSDERKALALANALSEDLRLEWIVLLQAHPATVNPELRSSTAFDYAIAEVRFAEMTARVTRGRGELRVEVARSGLHGYWEELPDLLRASGKPHVALEPRDGLRSYGNALQNNWETVVATMAGY